MEPAQVIQELRIQVERQGVYNELECGKLLSQIAPILLSKLDSTYFHGRELNTSAGRTDFVVIADKYLPGNEIRRVAYVWELKAPQHYLFEVQSKNRASPCNEFYAAENQLLHYHNSLANDGHFRDRWAILSHDDIKFGGIIIGRDENLVKAGQYGQVLEKRLASQALRIRENAMYKAPNIYIWTWDMVLKLAESMTLTHQMRVGDPRAPLDLSRVVQSSTGP